MHPAQCGDYMKATGHECEPENTVLMCFAAGGYPKPPCKQSCEKNGKGAGQGKYTKPGGTKVTMSDFYGPFGIGPVKFPTLTTSQGECDWSETRTEVLKSLSLAVDSTGQYVGHSCESHMMMRLMMLVVCE